MYSRSPMTSDGSQGSSHVSDFLGHRLADRAFLSADLLQANSADDLDKFRAPTSMALMPAHDLLVIGFDSGEVQIYQGLDETGNSSPEPGPGFRLSETQAVTVLKQLENWNPFYQQNDVIGNQEKRSIFYGACEGSSELYLFCIVGSEVKLSWIKYQLPQDKYQISDAVVCPGMSKVICATEQGRLFIFEAVLELMLDEDQIADEQVEDKYIVIVAHEGGVACISTNESGNLAVTGGRDGKISIWQWGKDHFFHQVGQLYLTNLPILSVQFTSSDDSEITITLDTYVMCLKITKKTSVHYTIDQFPAKHIKMERGGGRVVSAQAMHSLSGSPNSFLVLRSSKMVEIVGPRQDDSLMVDERPVACLCIDHQCDQSGAAITAIAYLHHPYHPVVFFWTKNREAPQED